MGTSQSVRDANIYKFEFFFRFTRIDKIEQRANLCKWKVNILVVKGIVINTQHI